MTTSRFSINTILAADAVTCAAMGALLVGTTEMVAGLTGLPVQLLHYVGSSLFPIAAFMAAAARFGAVWPAAPWLAVAGNLLWVLASIGLLFWIAPNALGVSFVLVQAAAVALLAWLEYAALIAGGAPSAQAG